MMKSVKFVSSQISLWSILVLGLMITFGSISLQVSFAPPPENMMTVDPTLQPENVTASVGDLIIVVFSSGSSMRVPEPDKAAMEVSWVGGGNYRGMTNISDFGTVMVETGADGISRSHGQGMIMNSQGEVATYRIQGLGNMGADGNFRNHGIVFFNATPGGVFEQLSSTVGVFANEVNQKGNAVTKIWELQ
ncbi:MAG TPA: hypothetical protein VFZ60_02135 [Nitrososphaeraceae archaeon]|jgi:hypothetical protein